MMKVLSLIICVLIICISSDAQQSVFQGRVLDYTNDEPLPLATVYLNNTTIGTSTDEEGYFSLKVDGSYEELIVSFVGYQFISHQIDTEQLNRLHVFKLRPSRHLLKEAIITESRSSSWYDNLEFFTNTFLGPSTAASKTKIVNPNVLYFEKSDSIFQAYAREPLIIENPYTGYRVHYILDSFTFSYQDFLLINLGYPRFELLEGSSSKRRKWKRNRERIYKGSFEHFLHSMCADSISNEFEVRSAWPKDKLVLSALLQLGILPTEYPILGDLNYEELSMALKVFSKRKLARLKYIVDNKELPHRDKLEKVNGQFLLSFDNTWKVTYNKQGNHNSFMYLSDGTASLDKNCRLINPLDIWVERKWSKSQVANMLPFDELNKRFRLRSMLNSTSN